MESSQDTIILCSPKTPYLCIGYHQVLDAVLDRKICDNKELPILRRRVGGGATYLDHNQVFYQCIFHHSRVPARADKVYQMMLEAPVQVLNQLGLDGRLRAVNEVEANSMRIAGIGGGRVGDAMVVIGITTLAWVLNRVQSSEASFARGLPFYPPGITRLASARPAAVSFP